MTTLRPIAAAQAAKACAATFGIDRPKCAVSLPAMRFVVATHSLA
jgi:hypothetical protein